MALTPEQIEIRNAFLNGPKPREELVTYMGKQLAVRQPTLELKGEIQRAARIDVETDDDAETKAAAKRGKIRAKVSIDVTRMEALAVIALTYFPGTDVKVFNDVDYKSLVGQVTGGPAAQLGDVAMKLMNSKGLLEEAEKKSEATPS